MKKIILDLDTGVDDALAIAHTIGQESVELIGITTIFGNVTVDYATSNSLGILDLLGRSDVPVYEGCSHPWGSHNYVTSDNLKRVHGNNGIGNVDLGENSRSKEETSAIDFIIESANAFGEDLILLTAGPLTNLAEAIKKDEEAVKKIGKIVTMGCALTIPGNVTKFGEANIINDPVAAKYVFESDISMVIVGLDVTLKTMITGNDIKSWLSVGNRASKAMVDLATYYYSNEYNDEEIGGAMHDPLAVEVAVNPDIVTNMFPINLTVETEGPSRGRTIGNLDQLNSGKKTSQYCLDVNGDLFIEKFIQTVQKVLSNSNKIAVESK